MVSSQATSPGLSTTGSAASCVRGFSPEALVEAGFAFDGTVVTIGDSATFDFERRVTFEVHHWYAGQSALTAAGSEQVDGSGGLLVDMPAPDGGGSVTSEGLAYAVGERLLVSGAVRGGSGPAQGPVAWSCGFTGAYDTAAAQIWQDAFAATGGCPGRNGVAVRCEW